MEHLRWLLFMSNTRKERRGKCGTKEQGKTFQTKEFFMLVITEIQIQLYKY